MRVGLVTPIGAGPLFNPGCDQITAGIRYLVRQVDPRAVFVPIEMMRDEPDHWRAAATCDAVILCGNPRFSLSEPAFWECGIWHRLHDLEAAGVRVIDGWAGAAHAHAPGMTIEAMAEAITTPERASIYLGIAGSVTARITRDPLMQMIYARAGIESTLLPCSSWWAAREYGVAGRLERELNAVVVYGMPGHDWLADAVRAMADQAHGNGLPTIFISSTWNDHRWTMAADIPAVFLPDPASLLRVFSRCKRVASMRLHAVIPAASVGCEVAGMAIDSRMMALDPFGLDAVPFDEIESRPLDFRRAVPPDESIAVETLRGALQ